MSLEELIVKLFDINGIKFGDFTVRTGEHTPIYIDMRRIWSYPDLVRGIGEELIACMKAHSVKYDVICGIPYQGIPLATYISTTKDIPMLLKRKTSKTYGTKQLFEGHYKQGDKAVVIDDVLMTGGTLVEDIPEFREAGMEVSAVLCFMDREQGGYERVKQVQQTNAHSVIKISKVLDILVKAGRITQATVDPILEYLKTNRWDTPEFGCRKPEEIHDGISNGTS